MSKADEKRYFTPAQYRQADKLLKKVQLELEGFGTLFENLHASTIPEEALHKTGTALLRMATYLNRIQKLFETCADEKSTA